MGSGSGEGVPLEVLPALYLSVDAPLLVQSSSAALPNLSRPQLWSSHLAGAHERHAFGPQLWTSCQAGTRKAEGSAALPSGTDPRTGQRAPNQEPALLKGETCFCPGVLSSPCPGLPVPGLSWFRFTGSPALPLLLVPLCFVPPDVSFPWPRASRSSSQREGRRVKRRGTDSRTGTGHRPKDRLFQVPFYVRVSRLFRRACLFPFIFATYNSRCASRSGCFPATLDCSLLASSYPPFGLGKFYLHSAITVLTFRAVCEPDIYAPSM